MIANYNLHVELRHNRRSQTNKPFLSFSVKTILGGSLIVQIHPNMTRHQNIVFWNNIQNIFIQIHSFSEFTHHLCQLFWISVNKKQEDELVWLKMSAAQNSGNHESGGLKSVWETLSWVIKVMLLSFTKYQTCVYLYWICINCILFKLWKQRNNLCCCWIDD